MHRAPAVQWKVSRTWFQGPLLAVLMFALAVVHITWWVQSPERSMALVLGSVAAFCGCGLAWRDEARRPSGSLWWDGQSWWWTGSSFAAQAGTPAVAMDLQSAMLLCWDFHGGGRLWLWLDRDGDAACWSALRRALFASGAVTVIDPLQTAAGPARVELPR